MINEIDLRNRIKRLRIQSGLSEAQVAEQLGRAGNSYVNRIENGPTKINIEILEELCAFYKVNPIELLQAAPSRSGSNQPKGFFDKSSFRGMTKLESDAREQIKEQLPTLRKIGKLQKLLQKEPVRLQDISPALFDLKSINTKSPYAAQSAARKAAAQVRAYFEIDKNSSIDITLFCQRHLNIPICGLDLGQECWGLYSSDKYENPLIIYSDAHKFAQRNVFTIAHELGHYLFSHDQLNIDCDSNENDVVEKIANTFAQELLVPSDALRQTYDELGLSLVHEIKPSHVVSLCEHFKVSFFMMVVCLRQIGKISSQTFDSLKDFCMNRLEHESQNLDYRPEAYLSKVKPLKQQLRDLTVIALRRELIGFFEASQLLDEPEASLKAAL